MPPSISCLDATSSPFSNWHPSIRSLHQLISTDPKLSTLFSQMLSSLPPFTSSEYHPLATPPATSLTHLCHVLNTHLNQPPNYSEFLQPLANPILVGFPLLAHLLPFVYTPPALSFFLDPHINNAFRDILSAWASFLSSRASLRAFSREDWGSPAAIANSQMHLFEQPDPDAPGWGYASWNAWFIRRFRLGIRPIAHPHDSSILIAPCEAAPYALVRNVPLHGPPLFTLKGARYSLHEMFDGDDKLALPFVNGDVYQAYLDTYNYHRWHAPVSGTVMTVRRIQGSYFALSEKEGFDETAGCKSLAFMSYVATRMVMVIRAEKGMGLVALVMIGMGECSSVVATVEEGEEVKKGDEIGYFQFGGSTYCLVMQKGVVEEWRNETDVQNAGNVLETEVVEVNAWLARVNGV